ncbi:hypothetical protein MTO96_048159 [Rhipicephalus appendiculatus]
MPVTLSSWFELSPLSVGRGLVSSLGQNREPLREEREEEESCWLFEVRAQGVGCELVGYVCPSFPKASTQPTEAFTGAWRLFYHSGYCRGPGTAWSWWWTENSAADDGVHRERERAVGLRA